jgi:hypothetical protein
MRYPGGPVHLEGGVWNLLMQRGLLAGVEEWIR